MNIYKSNLFPYITGDSLVGKSVTLTIINFDEAEIPRGDRSGKVEEKYLLSFRESRKKLILNKTNAKVLISACGPETDKWIGVKVKLFTERATAFGREHNSIRLAVVESGLAQPSAPAAAAEPEPAEPEPAEIDPLDLFADPETVRGADTRPGPGPAQGSQAPVETNGSEPAPAAARPKAGRQQ